MGSVIFAPELLLVGAVIGVGILHTIVPDHWMPITLIARQQGWSRRETAQAALKAGTGHVVSTLLIGLIVWGAGVAFATRFGSIVSTISSLALIAFGGWIAVASLRELRDRGGHGHSHSHDFDHLAPHAAHEATGGIHGPELQRVQTDRGTLELSIFESGVPPCFRLTGANVETVSIETTRDSGARQTFFLVDRGGYWQSIEAIPEPHEFRATIVADVAGHTQTQTVVFAEHEHAHVDEHAHHQMSDSLYKPSSHATTVIATHAHLHRHGDGAPHRHLHDHGPETMHALHESLESDPPDHQHEHKRSLQTALLLILGSSPMIEGIPAFFAAGKYGVGLIALMSIAFGLSTIATYVVLCVYSTAGLKRVKLGSFEKYGEVISGAFIALVGIVFLIFPVL